MNIEKKVHRPGKIIMISGFSGSGKSTLVKHVLDVIPSLQYVVTTTTRSPRTLEERINSWEYDFVNVEKYYEYSAKSSAWVHFEIYGNLYGTDLDYVNRGCLQGVNFILNVYPDGTVIEKLKNILTGQTCTIFINTPQCITKNRLVSERTSKEVSLRSGLDEKMNLVDILPLFDVIFNPTRISLEHDKALFLSLVLQKISE